MCRQRCGSDGSTLLSTVVVWRQSRHVKETLLSCLGIKAPSVLTSTYIACVFFFVRLFVFRLGIVCSCFSFCLFFSDAFSAIGLLLFFIAISREAPSLIFENGAAVFIAVHEGVCVGPEGDTVLLARFMLRYRRF